MAKKKRQRWAEMKAFGNVLEFPEGVKGNWHAVFSNDFPIVLELACGKGEYTLGLAEMHPGMNFIGVDRKGARMWRGAKTASEKKLPNVRFLRIFIEKLDQYFAGGEVSGIWITFPDPFLKRSKARNRLTSPRFLEMYRRILPPGGMVHLKTDSRELYDYTLETIGKEKCTLQKKSEDVYAPGETDPALQIKTYYEQMHLAEGRKILYLCFVPG